VQKENSQTISFKERGQERGREREVERERSREREVEREVEREREIKREIKKENSRKRSKMNEKGTNSHGDGNKEVNITKCRRSAMQVDLKARIRGDFGRLFEGNEGVFSGLRKVGSEKVSFNEAHVRSSIKLGAHHKGWL